MDTKQPKRVLIIEDDIFIADVYYRQLKKEGFLVKIAENGIKGLQFLLSEHFDVLLLDLMLPGLNGLEVLKQWRAKNPSSTMPIFILTNYGLDSYMQEAFSLGARKFFIKASANAEQIVKEINKIFQVQHPFQSNAPAMHSAATT